MWRMAGTFCCVQLIAYGKLDTSTTTVFGLAAYTCLINASCERSMDSRSRPSRPSPGWAQGLLDTSILKIAMMLVEQALRPVAPLSAFTRMGAGLARHVHIENRHDVGRAAYGMIPHHDHRHIRRTGSFHRRTVRIVGGVVHRRAGCHLLANAL